MERKEKEQFPDSKPTLEKPFKMYNDSKHISVWLNPEDLATNGWVLDQTPATQVKHTLQFRVVASDKTNYFTLSANLNSLGEMKTKLTVA